nr:hypothetical protein [Tanacetum cinerariifolium]
DKDCWFLLGSKMEGSGGSWVVVGRQEIRRNGLVGLGGNSVFLALLTETTFDFSWLHHASRFFPVLIRFCPFLGILSPAHNKHKTYNCIALWAKGYLFLLGMMVEGSGGSWVVVGRKENGRNGLVGPGGNSSEQEQTMATTIDQQAFQVTADVPEIYMQEFWAMAKLHHNSIRFKIDTKKSVLDLEAFREMLHISPRIPIQSFAELPSEE